MTTCIISNCPGLTYLHLHLCAAQWTETSKGHPRTLDCREIAKYDVVLTTFQLASTLHTLRCVGVLVGWVDVLQSTALW